MYCGKPIIGIAGGIGSGKSLAARLLGEMGCHVIDSDAQVREAYRDPAILQTLRQWWGHSILTGTGELDRRSIARRIFSTPADKQRLERLLHPWVSAAREREMAAASQNPKMVAFVWDTPLLFEVGLNRECDAVIFVESDASQRQKRVANERGWDADELVRREKLQWPLDTKREISDYVIENTADAGILRGQLRDLLTRILQSVCKYR